MKIAASFAACLVALSFLIAPARAEDARMIGTWSCTVSKKEGTWKIIWEQGGSGLYRSVVSGPGYIPEEWGLFTAGGGKYNVKARNGRTDVGTYKIDSPDQMTLVGQTGEVTVWHRLNDKDKWPPGQPWPAIPAPQAMPYIPPGVPVMFGHIKPDEKPSAANNWGYGDVDPNPDPKQPYVLDDDEGNFNPKYPPKPGQPIY